ncbi:NUDIX domain-containing protein [Nonomuraea sp. NPDC049129]|uniref:NUDIX hydrolase n=1 Tax=Nonomuraea sp. NPDC049129 TaxID=3155272 RepID=UPI0033E19C6A
MSFRLAAYAVCIEGRRVLLARHVPPIGESAWTLPGGRVEHGEDPFDAVIREVAEETGYDEVVERLLGVGSRVIPAAVACRRRSSLVDIGLALAQTVSATGHVAPVPVGGLIQH